jgi:hypothetical protein
MQPSKKTDASRRSSRVEVNIPILVTNSDSGAHFAEVCETLVVNAHGCALRSPIMLEPGVPLQFHIKEGRQALAHVVDCQPIGSDHQGWLLGASLARPDNFWGLKPCPEDWAASPEIPMEKQGVKKPAANGESVDQLQSQVGNSLKVVLDKIQKQLSDDRLKAMVAELIQPLQAEIAELRERPSAGGEAARSRFEVSLSHIPPEVEEKLWIRLRQDLGQQVLQQTRAQSGQLLEDTKAAIEQKITGVQEEFRQRATQELQAVAQQAHSLSEEMSGQVHQKLRAGTEEFQQRALETAGRLQRQGEEFFRDQQQRMSQEIDSSRRQMEEAQAAAASESSRLQAQIADLGSRVAKLDESARRLESELETRLQQMASEIVSGAQVQLENAVGAALKEIGTRNAKELEGQLAEARGRLKSIQHGIEVSVSELLRAQVGETLQSFEQRIEELAQQSVGRWRTALGRDLHSIAKTLGEEFRSETSSNGRE